MAVQIPTVMALLREEYEKARESDAALKHRESQIGAVACFAEFADNWLAANRPVEHFFLFDSMAFRFPDNRRASLCRTQAETTGGDMQASSSISITGGAGFGNLPV